MIGYACKHGSDMNLEHTLRDVNWKACVINYALLAWRKIRNHGISTCDPFIGNMHEKGWERH